MVDVIRGGSNAPYDGYLLSESEYLEYKKLIVIGRDLRKVMCDDKRND